LRSPVQRPNSKLSATNALNVESNPQDVDVEDLEEIEETQDADPDHKESAAKRILKTTIMFHLMTTTPRLHPETPLKFVEQAQEAEPADKRDHLNKETEMPNKTTTITETKIRMADNLNTELQAEEDQRLPTPMPLKRLTTDLLNPHLSLQRTNNAVEEARRDQ
jgi:hypothetical protein